MLNIVFSLLKIQNLREAVRIGALFVLMFHIPVNNSSVMSGQLRVIIGCTSTNIWPVKQKEK